MTTEEKSKIESALMKECHASMSIIIALLSMFSSCLFFLLFIAIHPPINSPFNMDYLFFGCWPILIFLVCSTSYITRRHKTKLKKMEKKLEDFTEKEMMIFLKLPLE